MTANLANFPLLRARDDYMDWCVAAENLLACEGMASAIKQELPATASEAEKEEDAKMRAKLVSTIDPLLYVHLEQAATTYDLWMKLRTMFFNSGHISRNDLLKTLMNIKLENCDSMAQCVTQVMETGLRLRGLGFTITDRFIEDFKRRGGLPERYAAMIILAMEHSRKEMSADVIKTKLNDMCAELRSTSDYYTRKSNTL